MPEPAYFSIGLAMKQAVTPCRRAAARTSRFSMTRSSAALQHVLAVVERQLVLAGRIFGDHRLGRNALRGGRGIDVGKQRLHAVQMVDRIDLGLAALAAVEHGARPAARGRRRRAHWQAGRTPARTRRLDAGLCRQAPRPAAPAHGAGRTSSARRRGGTSTSAPGRAPAVCHAAAPACRGSASRADRRRRNPRSSPVSWTSSPVMSRPRIEIGKCRPSA